MVGVSADHSDPAPSRDKLRKVKQYGQVRMSAAYNDKMLSDGFPPRLSSPGSPTVPAPVSTDVTVPGTLPNACQAVPQ